MEFFSKPLTKELSGLVQSVWCYQSEAVHEFEQVQPTINSQLLINLHDNELRHWANPKTLLRSTGAVGAQGVLTSPLLIDTMQKRHVCGVAFSSFGLSEFCNLSAVQFTNSIIDATQLWGQPVSDLRDDLIKEPDPTMRCQTIENFLAERLIPRHDENELLEEILSLMRDNHTLTAIRKKTGLSQRALHTLFEKRIGIRPKTFARVARFSSTLEPMEKKAPLTDIALDSGFSDQAHFSREFRSFTGTAPTEHNPLTGESHHAYIRLDKMFKTPDSG